MINEYALEPEMVATWGDLHNYRFFFRQFGSGQGRLVSRYPKTWAKKVWQSFNGTSVMEKKRLEELLTRFQETMIKRKNCPWDDTQATWVGNALVEHARHPFKAIMTRANLENRPEILEESAFSVSPCPRWDNPHGMTVSRKAPEMAAAVRTMLCCCRWIKFIDPYFSKGKSPHKQSLSAFLRILGSDRPVGSIERVEVHSSANGATEDFLKEFYKEIVPLGLTVVFFQWQERPRGQALHNRYILTDLAGVSFNHGLDTGRDGETDDVNLLDSGQYQLRCREYDPVAPAFDLAASPFEIIGTRR